MLTSTASLILNNQIQETTAFNPSFAMQARDLSVYYGNFRAVKTLTFPLKAKKSPQSSVHPDAGKVP